MTLPAPKQRLNRSTLQGTCEGVNVLLFQGHLAAILLVQRGLFHAVCTDFDGIQMGLQTSWITLTAPIVTISAISVISGRYVSLLLQFCGRQEHQWSSICPKVFDSYDSPLPAVPALSRVNC